MIDPRVFRDEWRRLLARFGREWDRDQAKAYHEYLSPRMETAAFMASARSLWVSAKWFPRPADFLFLEASGDWEHVLRALDLCTPPEWG
jgi:hypothetical protein